MMSLDVVSMFTRIPTDKTQMVVRDKLVANPSLEKRTYIPIDNLIGMLTFSCGNNLLRHRVRNILIGKKKGNGITVVTSID